MYKGHSFSTTAETEFKEHFRPVQSLLLRHGYVRLLIPIQLLYSQIALSFCCLLTLSSRSLFILPSSWLLLTFIQHFILSFPPTFLPFVSIFPPHTMKTIV